MYIVYVGESHHKVAVDGRCWLREKFLSIQINWNDNVTSLTFIRTCSAFCRISLDY